MSRDPEAKMVMEKLQRNTRYYTLEKRLRRLYGSEDIKGRLYL